MLTRARLFNTYVIVMLISFLSTDNFSLIHDMLIRLALYIDVKFREPFGSSSTIMIIQQYRLLISKVQQWKG